MELFKVFYSSNCFFITPLACTKLIMFSILTKCLCSCNIIRTKGETEKTINKYFENTSGSWIFFWRAMTAAEVEFAAFPALPFPVWNAQDAPEAPSDSQIRITIYARHIWHQEVQFGQRTVEVQAVPKQLSPSIWSNEKQLPLLQTTMARSSSQTLLLASCSSDALLQSGDQ